MTTPRTAALYLRVSTDKQTTDNQREAVETMAKARGYEVAVYEEVESAAKARPVYERMMADARAGRVQAVAVVALDRLHRSMTGAVSTVLDLDRIGVPVMSVREGWLDTQGPVRPLLVAIFGWVAEQERAVLIERTKAGLARQGRRCHGKGPRGDDRARGGQGGRRLTVHPPARPCRCLAPWPENPTRHPRPKARPARRREGGPKSVDSEAAKEKGEVAGMAAPPSVRLGLLPPYRRP